MGRLDSALRPLPPLLIVTGQLDHAADSGRRLPAHVIRRPALAAAQDSPSAVSVQNRLANALNASAAAARRSGALGVQRCLARVVGATLLRTGSEIGRHPLPAPPFWRPSESRLSASLQRGAATASRAFCTACALSTSRVRSWLPWLARPRLWVVIGLRCGARRGGALVQRQLLIATLWLPLCERPNAATA
jgi:hypothetical protein